MDVASSSAPFGEFTTAGSAREALRQLARSGHLENPIPLWFKEDLVVALAISCHPPYCSSCERCLLREQSMTPAQIAAVASRRAPSGERSGEMTPESGTGPTDDWPTRGSARDARVFAAALALFRQGSDRGDAARSLFRSLGPIWFGHLSMFLSWARMAHAWADASAPLGAATPSDRAGSGGVADPCSDVTSRRWEYAFHNASWGMSLATPDGRFIAVNRAFAEMHGTRPEEWTDRPLVDMFAEESRSSFPELAKRVGETSRLEYESVHVRADGSTFPVLTQVSAFKDSDDRVLFRVANFQDITERKRAETVLRDQQEQYEALVRAASHIVYGMTSDGLMMEDSPTWRAFTGQTDLEWRSLDRRKAVHPDDRERVQAAFHLAMLDKIPVQFEYRVRHVSGEWRWMHSRATPLLNLDGSVRRWVGMLTDITEQKRADELLRESERRFRGTFDNAAVGIAHVGLDGRWLRVNDKLSAITGYSRAELLERSFQDITHPDDLAAGLEYARQVLEGKLQTYSLEKRYFRRDGEPVWVNLTVALSRATTGEPEYFITVVEDIQRRKKAEEAVREAALARERAHFFDLSLDLVCIANFEGRFLHLNPAFSKVLGHSTEVLLSRPFMEFVHPDDREATLGAMETLAIGGPVIDFVNRYRAADGNYRWLQWRSASAADGTIYAVARDVTADRELMESLRSSEARYRLVTDGIKDYAIFLLDRQGRIVTWNAGAERLKGYPASEMIGREVSLFYTDEDRAAGRPQKNLERAARDGRCEDEGVRVRKDGSRFWANEVVTALRATDGTVSGFARVTRDFTKRHQAERELREKEATLRAGLKEREILLQEIHHRVKNNLQVISSLMNLQARPLSVGPALSALTECRQRVEAIALIHEQLYQTQDYAHVPFDEYVRTMSNRIFCATGRNPELLRLEQHLDPVNLAVNRAIPCGLILNELITNAMKHAFRDRERGVVRVELRHQADAIVLSVSDDGVGLGNASTDKADTLGMQLVSMLVEQLRGRLAVHSEGGTRFSVTFPAEAAA